MKKSKEKLFFIILFLLFLILGFIALKKWEWLSIFGFEVYFIFFLLSLFSLFLLYLCFIPSRDAKVYLESNYLPDINTERVYDAKKLYFGQGFISRGIALPSNTLKTFWVKSGWIGIETKSGKSFEAPLSDLIVRYHIENDMISGYSLKEAKYNDKITFYYPGAAFEYEEWKDITGVLSQAADVKESKLSRISKWVMRIKDLDFGDIAVSFVSAYAADTLVEFATSETNYLNTQKGRIKRIIKKIMLWILIIFAIFAIVDDIWRQIEQHKIESKLHQVSYSDADYSYSVGADHTERYGDYPDDNITESYQSPGYTAEESYPVSDMGFENGYNELSGNMIHTDGRKFPFGLAFSYNSSTGEFYDILYTNYGSGTKLHLTGQMIDNNIVRMEGKDQGKDFILIFEGYGPYTGDAWWGDFHQDIELY